MTVSSLFSSRDDALMTEVASLEFLEQLRTSGRRPDSITSRKSQRAVERISSLLDHAAIRQATVVAARRSNQSYLIVPLTQDGAGTHDDSPGLQAMVDLMLAERSARQQLELDRDSLIDRIGQDFEELHWLRGLAGVLSASDATTGLESVAKSVLPQLQELIRAEAVVLVANLESAMSGVSWRPVRAGEKHLTQTGQLPISREECLKLAQQCSDHATNRPLVYNCGSSLQTVALATSARNVIAVPLLQSQQHYGWLIALNRIVTNDANGETRPSDLLSAEFGSNEVGLMLTAAGMLAGHARNIELFRAEEHLRLGVIESIAGAIDARDPYTCGHSRRVAQMATRIAMQLGHSQDDQERIYVTGLMHDVGKIGVPDDILKKPGRLSDEEFEIIKQHPTIGHTILSPLKRLAYVLPGVLHHHERLDGKGYPHGLSGGDIPLDARILAVADSYDAMTSDRAYRPGMPVEKATGILHEGAGTQWDPAVVTAFFKCLNLPH